MSKQFEYKFKVVCNRCGHDNVSIEPVWPPYWDEGYIMNCGKCGARGDEFDELVETDWIKSP